MKIKALNPVPIWVWSMIYKVRDTYLMNLKNKILFQAKLDNLIIDLDVREDIPTGGQCDNIFGSDFIKMSLVLNPKDGGKYCSYVTAHEFAHLLFFNIFDAYGISGRAHDGSTNMTAIRRFCSDGTGYAEFFEELNADFLAQIVAEMLDFSDPGGVYKDFKRVLNLQNKVVENFEAAFCKFSLRDSDYLDAVIIAGEFEPSYYWDAIMSFSFSNIIDYYDSVIGEGAFRSFSCKVDEYFSKMYKEEVPDEIGAFTMLEEIIREAEQFRLSQTSEADLV